MILYHKTMELKESKVSIKKRQKLSEHFTFIPIQYDKKELMIQTPILYIPFGIQQYSINTNNKYLDISFQNIDNDIYLSKFLDNISILYNTIYAFFNKKYIVENFIKENKFSKFLRLKLNDSCHFYDQSKNIYNDDLPRTHGSFIIHLSGLWMMDNKIWFEWKLLQARIHIQPQLKEFLFIDRTMSGDYTLHQERF